MTVGEALNQYPEDMFVYICAPCFQKTGTVKSIKNGSSSTDLLSIEINKLKENKKYQINNHNVLEIDC